MFDQIQPKTETETITRHSLTLTLNEDEINAILVDPRKFQKALRDARSAWSMNGNTWSLTGRAPRQKDESKKAGRKGQPHQPAGKVKCAICSELVGAQGLHKHLARHQREQPGDE